MVSGDPDSAAVRKQAFQQGLFVAAQVAIVPVAPLIGIHIRTSNWICWQRGLIVGCGGPASHANGSYGAATPAQSLSNAISSAQPSMPLGVSRAIGM